MVINTFAAKKDVQIHMITDYSADIYNLKNTMIDKALFTGVDYIMWIDSDMVFTAEDIEMMIARDVDIISGVAMIEPGRAAVAWQQDDGGIQYYVPDEKDTGFEEVDYCGGAFLLVKADVYRKIPPIWYETTDQMIGTKHKLMSEDFGFCVKAKAHGYKIHVELESKVGHEKRVVLWPN